MKIIKLHLIASAVIASFASQADDSIDEIERIQVTADFRTQSVQKTAASVSVLGEQLIEARQAQHMENILNVTPNVNFASGSSRGRYVQIRGIGERSQFTSPINPSVGLILDGIDFSNHGGMGTLFDVQQVEVLRGPQGTTFGASALAGVINMTSNEPTAETSGKVEATLAQDNTWGLAGAVGGAISDNLLYRISANQFKSDGFTENTYLGRDDTNNIDELTSRLKLRWLASETLSIDTSIHYIDVDNGYDAFSLDNTRETLSDEPGHDRLDTLAGSIKVDWQGADFADVQVLLTHNDSESEYGYDEDWSFVGIHPWEYSSFDNYLRDRKTSTADLRLLSKPEQAIFGGMTDWVVGAYIKTDEEQMRREYTYLESDFSYDFDTDTVAVYGELNNHLNKQTDLIVGLRFESRDADYLDSDGFVDNTTDDMLGGRVILQHQSTAQTMVYGSVSRGYKAGGFNPDARLNEENRTFDSEYSWNYETGVKTQFTEVDASLRMAVFYMDRTDMQSKNTFVIPGGENEAPVFVDYTGNAEDDANNYGIELESQWQATENLLFTANLGWLETEADERENGDDEQAHAPNYQFYVAGQYDFNENWYVDLEVEGKDGFYFSDSHDEESDSYVLVHASLNYQLDDWRLSLWGKNLFDEDYYVRGFGGFGNDPRKFYEEEPYYQFGSPQQFGLTASYAF